MSEHPRLPLNRTRILEAAVELVDRQGLDALTMRRLGTELGVEAMSLYKHIANKEEILDGLVELVVGQIVIPGPDVDWRESMRQRARSAREVLTRHSWAIGLLEARTSRGPAALGYANAILGVLRSAGFSVAGAAHAFWLLDSYVYGHVVQETSMTRTSVDDATTPVGSADSPASYPHLAELEAHAADSGFSFDGEFEFGLAAILDSLERFAMADGG